ncbi:hypothetical protein D5018_02560 [Parashewanella curva]|uniref:Uncharacterized protein n=1 Tax=Parashewanella curva TaxID=2338552 RepID=A0A3L8Q123_9GAMM|nr:hypothetical protein [Parashewanella curva]RLV61377.1 hypothetical protein D5018_02560 [Parashewanella curva]
MASELGGFFPFYLDWHFPIEPHLYELKEDDKFTLELKHESGATCHYKVAIKHDLLWLHFHASTTTYSPPIDVVYKTLLQLQPEQESFFITESLEKEPYWAAESILMSSEKRAAFRLLSLYYEWVEKTNATIALKVINDIKYFIDALSPRGITINRLFDIALPLSKDGKKDELENIVESISGMDILRFQIERNQFHFVLQDDPALKACFEQRTPLVLPLPNSIVILARDTLSKCNAIEIKQLNIAFVEMCYSIPELNPSHPFHDQIQTNLRDLFIEIIAHEAFISALTILMDNETNQIQTKSNNTTRNDRLEEKIHLFQQVVQSGSLALFPQIEKLIRTSLKTTVPKYLTDIEDEKIDDGMLAPVEVQDQLLELIFDIHSISALSAKRQRAELSATVQELTDMADKSDEPIDFELIDTLNTQIQAITDNLEEAERLSDQRSYEKVHQSIIVKVIKALDEYLGKRIQLEVDSYST